MLLKKFVDKILSTSTIFIGFHLQELIILDFGELSEHYTIMQYIRS